MNISQPPITLSVQKPSEASDEKKKNSADPFFKCDLTCFLSCVYDLRTVSKSLF